jgi:hypothetical protein
VGPWDDITLFAEMYRTTEMISTVLIAITEKSSKFIMAEEEHAADLL